MKKVLLEHKWYIGGVFLFSILFMLPFLFSPYHENDDTVYHIANIVSLADSIRMHGIFGSPILPNLANNFGYASHLLYPPLSHTFSAIVSLVFEWFGLGIRETLKFVHLFVYFLSGLSMYELAFKVSKNKKIAFFSSIIYLSCPYLLSDHYVRDSLAEFFVFPFLPMIFSGIVSLLNGNKKSFYPLFVIGYIGGILSHFTMMIYFTFFLAIFLMIYYKKVFRKEFLKSFIIGCFVILFSVLFFLIPMFEYKFRGGIAVFLEGVMSGGVYNTSLWLYEYLPFSHFRDGVNFNFSLVSCLLLVLTCIQYKKIEKIQYMKGFIIIEILCLFFSSKLFYFDMLPSILYMIQFAWRLCTFLTIGIALLAPLCLKDKSNMFLIFVSICIVVFGYFDIHFRCDNIFHYTNETVVKSGAAMGWQHEYLPENALKNEDYYENRNQEILVKKGEATILESSVPNLKFEAKKDSFLELPRLYYIGYSLKDEKGNVVNFNENEMGFIEVNIMEDGIYTLTYPGTGVEQVGNFISIFTIIGSFVGYWYLVKKKELVL